MVTRNSVHFFVAITVPFPIFLSLYEKGAGNKKKKSSNGDKKMHGVPIHQKGLMVARDLLSLLH
jgi:hypothetical protein